MPNTEIDLNPIDFITVGTVGPKGQRIFHLQAGKGAEIITLTVEKEQTWALGEAIREMIRDLDKRLPAIDITPAIFNMELRDPVEPMFRVAQMGLGYDDDQDKIVLIAQEFLVANEDPDAEEAQPGVVRLWCSRAQMRALSEHSVATVQAGRPDPKQNGRLIYYWT